MMMMMAGIIFQVKSPLSSTIILMYSNEILYFVNCIEINIDSLIIS